VVSDDKKLRKALILKSINCVVSRNANKFSDGMLNIKLKKMS